MHNDNPKTPKSSPLFPIRSSLKDAIGLSPDTENAINILAGMSSPAKVSNYMPTPLSAHLLKMPGSVGSVSAFRSLLGASPNVAFDSDSMRQFVSDTIITSSPDTSLPFSAEELEKEFAFFDENTRESLEVSESTSDVSSETGRTTPPAMDSSDDERVGEPSTKKQKLDNDVQVSALMKLR